MLRNYILVALRSMKRRKLFTCINVIGFGLSMAVCLFIIAIIDGQFSFDAFHERGEHIYRITSHYSGPDGSEQHSATAPAALAGRLRDECSSVDRLTRINTTLQASARNGDRMHTIEGLYTEPDFLKMFSFELLRGNPAQALAAPFTIILTETSAQALFGSSDVLGKHVRLEDVGDFRISGIIRQPPADSHIRFQALASLSTLNSFSKAGGAAADHDGWRVTGSDYLYTMLRPEAESEDLQAYLDVPAQGRAAGDAKLNLSFEAQPLEEIVPGRIIHNPLGRFFPLEALLILIALVLVIMTSAAFNYANLTIAGAMTRSREVGIRKVNGARRGHIFMQFLTDALLTSLLSLLLAIVLLESFLPLLYGWLPGLQQHFEFRYSFRLYLQFFLFSVACGLAAGLVPAQILSRFQPSQILRDFGRLRLLPRLTLRKILIATQLAISLLFIMSGLTVYRQLQYALSYQLGFNSDNIVNVQLFSVDYQRFYNEMIRQPGVVSIAAASVMPCTGSTHHEPVFLKGDTIPFISLATDRHFLPNLSIPLIAGRNFAEHATRQNREIIINEAAVATLHIENPSDAPGRRIELMRNGERVSAIIVGVVADFHSASLVTPMTATMLSNEASRFSYAGIRLAGVVDSSSIAALAETWRGFASNAEFSYEVYKDQIEQSYEVFFIATKLMSFLAALVVILAALGLLGIVVFSLKTRMKEISIRKVLGANFLSLLSLLTRGFLLIIGAAILLATPLAWLMNTAWLQEYAYRIDFGFEIVGLSVLVLCALLMIVIIPQTLSTIFASPLKMLRSE